jgi:hypothetical protein
LRSKVFDFNKLDQGYKGTFDCKRASLNGLRVQRIFESKRAYLSFKGFDLNGSRVQRRSLEKEDSFKCKSILLKWIECVKAHLTPKWYIISRLKVQRHI